MQFVNFDAVVKNAAYFKSILGKTQLCAVVKSDAYGHGLVRTASALCGVADWFAVGNLAEAKSILPFARNILILLPCFGHDCKEAAELGLVQTVDSFETLERVVALSPKNRPARVHLKLETGMNRLGFSPMEISLLCSRLESKRICVEGVFTHLFSADKTQCDKQLESFQKAADSLEFALKTHLMRHIANTSAVLSDKKYHLDMARVGLGLFGYGGENLLPAKKVTAPVVAVRRGYPNQTVGYDGKHKITAETNLAVINAGYANGFPRALQNACVKICGKSYPVVGNVCMSMLMVDLGDDTVPLGTQAVLLGEGVNNSCNQVIVYELLCNLK